MTIFTKKMIEVYETDLKETKAKLKKAKTRLDLEVLGERVYLLEGFIGTLITILDVDLGLSPDVDDELKQMLNVKES